MKYCVPIDTTEEGVNAEAYCAGRGVDVVGSVPYGPLALDAVNSGRPAVTLNGPASRALRATFDRTRTPLMSPINPGERR